MLKASFWHRLQNYPWMILSAVWIIATLININKAFHIDDTFHLEAAEWIQHNPLRPMSGYINWVDTDEPIHHFNQPPLYFYLIASVGALFGYNEIALHLLQSVFILISIVFFYKLAKLFNKEFALSASILLALGPGFLVNQNLMTDIPILSISVMFMYYIIKADKADAFKNLFIAALILSGGLLIKYTLLPLVIILIYKVWQQKKIRVALVLLLPVFTIAFWSLTNYLEYGGSHILGRPKNTFTPDLLLNNSVSFLLTLGAIVPFTLIFCDHFLKSSSRYTIVRVCFGIVTCVVIVYLLVYGIPLKAPFYSLFWVAFFTNGLMLIIFPYILLRRTTLTPTMKLIVLWFVGLIGFIVLFAPFMATRHSLLILPPLLIIIAYTIEQISTKAIVFSISFTILLGILLSISDWQYANFYRASAPVVIKKIPSSAKVWTVGHWGWQWYSKKAGMEFYDSEKSKPEVGDYFVVPKRVYQQKIEANMKFSKVDEIICAQNMWNSLTTAHYARFYHTYPQFIPWFVSLTPVDSIIIYKIIE
ncbi:glycosyltransferase family 39 protein [Pontibacter sp. HSC-36F09]|uniref:ArnT family glycosyltransferase n=1 Tax=Pontibacter sp. HSC-36F09 TaxID=2910966 RepID=UPI00209ECBD3|nr:glycosyltransferase family 39 protein [Pontibacter sp. HSC-36F09]MCP2043623.1 4-amino-4-deoxy-L-arabinose transferase-like glycosyltransferase [Pontibacter sp. HSC-36F09]